MIELIADMSAHFAAFSLLAFGGMAAVIPTMHHYLVDTMHLMSGEQFSSYYTISQITPGPNMLFVSLFGWHVAGVWGALAVTAAVCVPPVSIAVVYSIVAARVSPAWTKIIRAGMAPIAVGLLLASAWVLALNLDAAFTHWIKAAIVSGITMGFMLTGRVHPFWLIGCGAILGALGVLS